MLDDGVKAELDYHALNAMLNLYDADGKIQFEKDREAANQYFLQHVNQNTVFFHSLNEKLGYLVDEGYYEAETLDQYPREFVHAIWDAAYARKFRFPTFLGAFKYYTSYTLKTRDGQRYLERYEDRVVMVALALARGDQALAMRLMDEIMSRKRGEALDHVLLFGPPGLGKTHFSRRLASALKQHGIGKNDTVAAVLANTPAMLECHYGVAMAGAVLNTLNTRLDAPVLAFTAGFDVPGAVIDALEAVCA